MLSFPVSVYYLVCLYGLELLNVAYRTASTDHLIHPYHVPIALDQHQHQLQHLDQNASITETYARTIIHLNSTTPPSDVSRISSDGRRSRRPSRAKATSVSSKVDDLGNVDPSSTDGGQRVQGSFVVLPSAAMGIHPPTEQLRKVESSSGIMKVNLSPLSL